MLCAYVCLQPSRAEERWRGPGGAGVVESVRQQARYDQSHVEEHPAAEDTDDEDEVNDEEKTDKSSEQQGR